MAAPMAAILLWGIACHKGNSAMRVVILDRDGVINEDRDDFVKNSLEFIIMQS